MPKAASARRYAQAVFQIALERDELDTWADDLSFLAEAHASSEFAGFLDAPQVPASQKVAVVRSALGDSLRPLAVNLLCLLATRDLAHVLPEVADQYGRMVDEHRGVARAEVVSAVALDDGQRGRVAALLEEIVGKETRLTVQVEPAILGGLVARVGDRVINGSTRTKLETLRRELVEGRS